MVKKMRHIAMLFISYIFASLCPATSNSECCVIIFSLQPFLLNLKHFVCWVQEGRRGKNCEGEGGAPKPI